MMMITRTASHIEVALGENKAISIEVGRITGAMLAAERAPCGRIIQSLLLMTDPASAPMRIDGSPAELTEVHQYVVETMLCASEAEEPAEAPERWRMH